MGTVMPRILVIEKSSTRRHALARHLAASALEPESVATYEEALARLRDPAEAFSAVVLGWPERAASITDELLVTLDESAYRHIAVIVLSESEAGGQLNWITERPRTALLTWEDFRQIDQILRGIWRRASAETASDATIPGDAGDTRGIRILLVDDSPTARLGYAKLLRQNGYSVDVADSVGSGFEQAVSGAFDIAIIDYFMPGETGDMLCRRLRHDQRTRAMTNSVLTGTYIDYVIADSLAAGAVECMFKNEANELFLARVAAMSRAVRGRRSVERERRYLEGILGSVGDGVYGVDNTGRLSFMNPTARRMLGLDASTRVVGEDPCELLHDGEETEQTLADGSGFLARAYASGAHLEGWHAWFRKADGHRIPVEGTIHPLTIDGARHGSVVAFRDVTERQLLEDQLRWQANHDPLTKLLNRHYFDEQLQQEVHRLRRSEQHSALVYIDLDQFKYINDTAGHAAGDQLLLEIAERLSASLRATDMLARLGGDEFGLLIQRVRPDALDDTGEFYRQTVCTTEFVHAGQTYSVSASVGVALIDCQTEGAGTAMANADLAANIAKSNGRNQTHVFEPSDDDRRAMHHELGWSAKLMRALERDELELALQPIVPVDIDTDAGPGGSGERWSRLRASLAADRDWQYEVLLRLCDEEGQWVLPSTFLPAAERFSLMPAIDRWVIERSLRLLASMPDEPGGGRPALAINLAGESLHDRTLGPWIGELIERHGIDPHQLAFEITETSAITNLEAVQALMAELQARGCRFALDDFGSGFSSFGQLKALNVDYVKIDGQFIQGLVSDQLDRQVVLAIVQIAHSVGMKTVAEFVDNPHLLPHLRECGVDFVQGHCIAPALAAAGEGGIVVPAVGAAENA